MKVLHFYHGKEVWNIRLQRFIQHDLNCGFQPVIFTPANSFVQTKRGSLCGDNKWIPNANEIPVETFQLKMMAYVFSSFHDNLGLKKVFHNYGCDLVHAHDLPSAYYAFKLGLPTVLNDYEYLYEYYRFPSHRLKSKAVVPLRFYRKIRAKKMVAELLRALPVIVTNSEVEKRYRQLGAQNVWAVPNVPCKFEVDYALKCNVGKRDEVTTCYVGNINNDRKSPLRNTCGIQELWEQNDMGKLLVFEGANYVPHLEIFRILKSCHYNLLYWKPLSIHKYYLQNKPFLASIVGVPTIIVDSLVTTIRLLGEQAIPIHTLSEIEKVVHSDAWQTNRRYPNPAHLFESYSHGIIKAYKTCLNQNG